MLRKRVPNGNTLKRYCSPDALVNLILPREAIRCSFADWNQTLCYVSEEPKRTLRLCCGE